MNIDFDLLLEKYSAIKEMYIDKLDYSFLSKPYSIAYAKDSSYIYYDKNMYSHSLLHHFNAKKCMFKRLMKKLPQNANPDEYTAFYFDSDNKLIFSSLKLDDNRRNITVYFDENIQINYLATKNSDNKECFNILSVEVSEYDNNNIIKCETFKNVLRQPYGISISIEYYNYSNDKLTEIESYENYNRNFVLNDTIKMFCPDRIIHPEHYKYQLIPKNDDILIKKIHYFSEKDSRIEELLFKQKEILKLKSKGIECLGHL